MILESIDIEAMTPYRRRSESVRSGSSRTLRGIRANLGGLGRSGESATEASPHFRSEPAQEDEEKPAMQQCETDCISLTLWG